MNDIKFLFCISHYFASKPNLFWRKTKIINIVNKCNLSQSILKKNEEILHEIKYQKELLQRVFKEFCSNYRTERAKETDSYLIATHREKKKYIGLNHPSSTFEDSCFLSYASCICWEIRKRIYEIILISLSSNRWQLSWKRVLLITDLNTRWPSRTLLIFIDTFQFNRKFQFPCFFLFFIIDIKNWRINIESNLHKFFLKKIYKYISNF